MEDWSSPLYLNVGNTAALTSYTPAEKQTYELLNSTETALVRVSNDLLIASDSGSLSIHILLDLSTAFDIVNHNLLLNRLKTVFGISGTVLFSFESYLSDRHQFVGMNGFRSDIVSVSTGVPQGSTLDPLLFSSYSMYLFLVCS